MVTSDTPALACTLELSQMRPRLDRLQRLAENSLLSHQLQGNLLRLAYEADAAAEVRAVVDLERDCCQFFNFEMEEGGGEVRLTISAPEGVGAAVEWLFAQFMPVSRVKPAVRPCCASCT